ncbi:hypothetical protein HPNQ4099_1022, partial [Helicobacter pylori NQ4099]
PTPPERSETKKAGNKNARTFSIKTPYCLILATITKNPKQTA